jgi:predicted dienelactone hydrolase
VLDVAMDDTYRDVPGSEDGPFPLVLFSHGFGSFRLDASALARGMASWGFVVAAPAHIERDRAALLTNAVVRAPEKDVEVLVATVALVGGAGGALAGLTDTELVGAVGHSAGGRAALSALSEPEIDVAVGWAAAGRADVPAPDKPSMNIAARVDVLVPIEEVEETYAGMNPPKRLVVIDGAGHNSFTDICLPVKNGTDLIGLAQRIGFAIPDSLAAGGRDGCEPGSIDTELGWEITQHFTVAELRDALGLDDGTGLGEGVTEEFDATIEYRQDLG